MSISGITKGIAASIGVLLWSAAFVLAGNKPQDDLKNEAGKTVFETNCLDCHQADGSGVPMLAPPLIKTSYVMGDKFRLIGIVLNGFDEEVEIEGEYYSNPMPAFPQLSDKEVADVLTYVRTSFGNSASDVTEIEVKTERAKAESNK